jgi:hypothetical protein
MDGNCSLIQSFWMNGYVPTPEKFSDGAEQVNDIDTELRERYGDLTRIPPGRYLLKCHDWTSATCFKQPKLILHFRVADMGDCFGAPLERFYNIHPLTSVAGKRTRFKVGRSSDLLRELALVTTKPLNRLDRLPVSEFTKFILVAEIEDVTTGYRQQPIPDAARYSVVRKIVGIER